MQKVFYVWSSGYEVGTKSANAASREQGTGVIRHEADGCTAEKWLSCVLYVDSSGLCEQPDIH